VKTRTATVAVDRLVAVDLITDPDKLRGLEFRG
jgi:hypothetical protein